MRRPPPRASPSGRGSVLGQTYDDRWTVIPPHAAEWFSLSWGLIVAHISGREIRESRRDSITRPRVARHELAWVKVFGRSANPNGLVSNRCQHRFNPVGIEADFERFPQGSSCLATLGWRTQSLWDCRYSGAKVVGNDKHGGEGEPVFRLHGYG